MRFYSIFTRKHALVAGMSFLFACAATTAFIESGSGASATTTPQYSLGPQSFAALSSSATELAKTPSDASLLAEEPPAPGGVHSLGPNGMANAWTYDGQVCLVSGYAAEGDDYGGCVSPEIDKPIGLTVGTLAAEGLAINGVTAVTLTFSDGSSVTATPVNNYYLAIYPANEKLWNLTGVSASLSDGNTYQEALSFKNPALIHRMGG